MKHKFSTDQNQRAIQKPRVRNELAINLSSGGNKPAKPGEFFWSWGGGVWLTLDVPVLVSGTTYNVTTNVVGPASPGSGYSFVFKFNRLVTSTGLWSPLGTYYSGQGVRVTSLNLSGVSKLSVQAFNSYYGYRTFYEWTTEGNPVPVKG